MVGVKRAIHSWKRDVALVFHKPRLVVAVVIIGFFLLWLASEQVRACLRCLIHLRLAEEKHTERLKERYLLFGTSILVFVWFDLMLINVAFKYVGAGYRFFENRLSVHIRPKKNRGAMPIDVKPIRRNAKRFCRRETCADYFRNLHNDVPVEVQPKRRNLMRSCRRDS